MGKGSAADEPDSAAKRTSQRILVLRRGPDDPRDLQKVANSNTSRRDSRHAERFGEADGRLCPVLTERAGTVSSNWLHHNRLSSREIHSLNAIRGCVRRDPGTSPACDEQSRWLVHELRLWQVVRPPR